MSMIGGLLCFVLCFERNRIDILKLIMFGLKEEGVSWLQSLKGGFARHVSVLKFEFNF